MSNSLLGLISRSLAGERTSSIKLDDIVNNYNYNNNNIIGGWYNINSTLYELKLIEQTNNTEDNTEDNTEAILHVLSTMMRKLAKRSPSAEAGLVSSFLMQASSGVAPPLSVEQAVAGEARLRQEVMGTAMELAFEGELREGAALDTLCSSVAANAVNCGVASTQSLLMTLLSTPNLSPLPLLSIFKHVGLEAQSDGCPEPLNDVLRTLTQPFLTSVVLPILLKANEEKVSRALGRRAWAKGWSDCKRDIPHIRITDNHPLVASLLTATPRAHP